MIDFWEKLKTVEALSISKSSWRGFAKVFVTLEKDQSIVFHETGKWENTNLSFTNSLRWTLQSDRIFLEHLRLGLGSPVKLVEFALMEKDCLTAINPYLCGQDNYLAHIFLNQEGIHLQWNIQGPLKNERIYSHYF